MERWTAITFSATPLPNYVLVTGIAKEATEKTIQDLFSFCGGIVQLQLIPSEDGLSQEALIVFEKAESANTALLLTNAVILENAIMVQFFYSEIQIAKSASTDSHIVQESTKPRGSIIAELLAAGYLLSEKIVARAQEMDARLGVRARVMEVSDTVRTQVQKLDERFHVTSRVDQVQQQVQQQAAKVDQQFHVTENIQKALRSEVGLKITNTLTAAAVTVQSKAKELHEDSLRLVAERRPAPAVPPANIDVDVSQANAETEMEQWSPNMSQMTNNEKMDL